MTVNDVVVGIISQLIDLYVFAAGVTPVFPEVVTEEALAEVEETEEAEKGKKEKVDKAIGGKDKENKEKSQAKKKKSPKFIKFTPVQKVADCEPFTVPFPETSDPNGDVTSTSVVLDPNAGSKLSYFDGYFTITPACNGSEQLVSTLKVYKTDFPEYFTEKSWKIVFTG